MEMACDCSQKPPTACIHRQLVEYEAITLSFVAEKPSVSAESMKLDSGIFEFIGLLRYRTRLKKICIIILIMIIRSLVYP